MSAPVVVGVDGSPSSLDAVTLGAYEARLRGTGLRLVHAFLWPALHVSLGPSPGGPPEGGLRHQAERLVEEAAQQAHAAEPEVDVSQEIVVGEALTVLEAESADADLIVLGNRGLGAFGGLLLGSTAVELSAHARCPVMVSRGDSGAGGEVLLGVDGSPAAEPAVGFAFAEASWRRAELVAFHAWSEWTERAYDGPGDPLTLAYDPEHLHDEEERLLAEALSGWQDRYPDVRVRRRLVKQRTRPALIEASGSAQLLVVGARGRGGLTGLLLGSVSQAILHHSRCPVAVVRNAPL